VIGLVLGKFLPPHAGHVHLCEVAERMCDELVIVVASLPGEPISGAQRVAWLRELMPRARVEHLAEPMPQEPGEHPEFWRLWREALLRFARPDRVFTSDAYGAQLATELGAHWIRVDPDRETFPISGTAVRADPARHWAHLPRCVRAHYARRISVFGPESTGKTTLARALADALAAEGRRVAVVAEYLREFCDQHGRTPRRDEQRAIAAEQTRRIAAAAEALAAGAAVASRAGNADAAGIDGSAGPAIVLADTTALMIAVYSDQVFGDTGLYAEAEAAHAHGCELTLLTALDLPWRADGLQRDGPQVREPVDAKVRAALMRAGVEHAVVHGDGEARTRAALAAIRRALAPPPDALPEATRWHAHCERCSDPACERRQRLLPRG